MFNIYVCLAGRDMITDAGRNTTCRGNLKLRHYKHKVHKTKDISKKWVSKAKSLKISDKINNTSSLNQTNPWNARPLKTTIEYGLRKQY